MTPDRRALLAVALAACAVVAPATPGLATTAGDGTGLADPEPLDPEWTTSTEANASVDVRSDSSIRFRTHGCSGAVARTNFGNLSGELSMEFYYEVDAGQTPANPTITVYDDDELVYYDDDREAIPFEDGETTSGTFSDSVSVDGEVVVILSLRAVECNARDTTTTFETANVLFRIGEGGGGGGGEVDANLAVNESTPSVRETVEFDASGSTAPDGAEYRWDFDGDGETDATGETVTHQYDRAGSYDATLTVAAGGKTSTATERVYAGLVPENGAPTAAFTISEAAPDPDEVVRFDAGSSADPDGDELTYRWDFDGDGETDATGRRTSHAFADEGRYEVTLTADDGVATGTTTREFVVGDGGGEYGNAAPVAEVSVPSGVTPGETVTLSAADSRDPDGSVESYRWDTDGDPEFEASGATVETAFDGPGEHTVAVEVTDDDGATDYVSATVQVGEPAELPTPSIEVTDDGSGDGDGVLEAGEALTFDGTDSSASGAAAIEGYEWSFDDGTATSGASVTHAFTEPGTYAVELRVTDSRGGTETLVRSVDVEAEGEVPNFEIWTHKSGRLPLDAGLENTWAAKITAAADPIDRVIFEVPGAGRIVDDDPGRDGRHGWKWSAQFPVDSIRPDPGSDPMYATVTVVDEDGDRSVARTTVDVVDAPQWFDVAMNSAGTPEVNVDREGEWELQTTSNLPPTPGQFQPGIGVPLGPFGDFSVSLKVKRKAQFEYHPEGNAFMYYTSTVGGAVGYQVIPGIDFVEIGAGASSSQELDAEFFVGDTGEEVTVEAASTAMSLKPSVYGTLDLVPVEGLDGAITLTGYLQSAAEFDLDEVDVEGDGTPAPKLAPSRFEARLSPQINLQVGGGLEVPIVEYPVTKAWAIGGIKFTGRVEATDFDLDVGDVPPMDPAYEVGASGQVLGKVKANVLGFTETWTLFDPEVGASVYLADRGPGPVVVPAGESGGREWTAAEERGAVPAPAVGNHTATSAAAADAVTRLTRDGLADGSPDVAATGGEATAVWAGQAPAEDAPNGREIYARTRSGGTWGGEVQITDDDAVDAFPAVAGGGDGSVVAWVSADARADPDAGPAGLFPHLEVEFATRSGGSWSEPATLTDNARPEFPPTVAANGDAYLVAWATDTDGDTATVDDRRVEYAIVRDGAVRTEGEFDGRRVAAAGTADGFALAIQRGTDASATVARVELAADGTLRGTTAFDAPNASAVAAGANATAWTGAGGIAVARNGEVRSVPTGNVSVVGDLNVGSTLGVSTLSYRGIGPDTGTVRPTYQVLTGTGWSRPRTTAFAGNLTVTGLDTALSNGELVAVGSGTRGGETATGDVFAVARSFASDLAVTATVPRGGFGVGGPTEVEYAVVNRGELPSSPTSLVLSDREGTLTTVPIGTLAPGERVADSATVTLGPSGRIGVRIGADGREGDANDRAVAVADRPNLTVTGVRVTREDGRLRVRATVRNGGTVPAPGTAVRFSVGNATVTGTTPRIGAGWTWNVSATVDATATTATPVVVTADPGDAVDETSEFDNVERTRPQTDLGVRHAAVAAYGADGGSRLELSIRNAGVATATATVSVETPAGTRTFAVPVPGSRGDGHVVSVPVSLVVPELEAGDRITVGVEPARGVDADPTDDALLTTVESVGTEGDAEFEGSVSLADARVERAGGNATLVATVENAGDLVAGRPLVVSNGTVVVDTGIVAVPGTSTVRVPLPATASGEYTVRVGDDTATVTLDRVGPVEWADEDGDGTISTAELNRAIRRWALGDLTTEELQAIIRAWAIGG